MTQPVLLQLCAFPDWIAEALARTHEVVPLYRDPALLEAVAPRVTAVATHGGLGLPRAILDSCPRLEIVVINGVGYDAVDLESCRARGIAVTNTPDVLTEDCADLAVGLFLALARGVVKADAFAREAWTTQSFPLQRKVSGMRVGILGLGRIGAAVAARLQGFGCDLAYGARHDRGNGMTFCPDPVALAARSEALIVTTLSNAETRHIVDARVLQALGPRGLLVNISRAACLDEAALLTALETRAIAGAALDVFEGEPHLNPRFLTLDNVILQPHHASATVETRRAMGELMLANLAAHVAGLPLPSAV